MRLSTGRWVIGDDFFDRSQELGLLARLIEERNHVLLTGQRRMGKTSVVRELSRRLQSSGWTTLFVDLEGASCPEDVIALIAREVHSIRPIADRFVGSIRRFIQAHIKEISATQFGLEVRAGLNSGNWRSQGEHLIRACAQHEAPVLLAIDELPIFLKRLLRNDADGRSAEMFLSWLRSPVQALGDSCPIFILSGSIGLEPIVQSLGLSDRINHLYPFRLGPWNRETSVQCFNRLATRNSLQIESDVAEMVYDLLGIGIPHHVQSFFARLRDFSVMHDRMVITSSDVLQVYRNELLGPHGQSDLIHYESRLREGLGDENYSVAMEILAEAAVEGVFSRQARAILEGAHSRLLDDAPGRIADVLRVLVHDGYLEPSSTGHRFSSNLLRDWWSARFRGHHAPLSDRTQHRTPNPAIQADPGDLARV